MSYANEIFREYERLIRIHPNRIKLIRKSVSAKLAKLRRYIAMARGEHVPNQKWLSKVFAGRSNQTPWRIRKMKYISKAKRLAFAELVS